MPESFKHEQSNLFKPVQQLPALLYRLRLGFLLGGRVILISHTGRRSGNVFRSAVEVLEHDKKSREYIVCSGTGRNTDWYLNLVEGGPAEVQLGSRRWAPEMRFLDADEAATRLLAYERQHPTLAKLLLRSLGRSYDKTNTGRRRMVEDMPMVAFAEPPVD